MKNTRREQLIPFYNTRCKRNWKNTPIRCDYKKDKIQYHAIVCQPRRRQKITIKELKWTIPAHRQPSYYMLNWTIQTILNNSFFIFLCNENKSNLSIFKHGMSNEIDTAIFYLCEVDDLNILFISVLVINFYECLSVKSVLAIDFIKSVIVLCRFIKNQVTVDVWQNRAVDKLPWIDSFTKNSYSPLSPRKTQVRSFI